MYRMAPMQGNSMPRYEFELRARAGETREMRKRSAPEDFPLSRETQRRPSSAPLESESSEEKKPRKRPNYLNHDDRCCIIKRVAQGESQAALAREFGVTRAAVCQMYKKREEILSREENIPPPAPQESGELKPERERSGSSEMDRGNDQSHHSLDEQRDSTMQWHALEDRSTKVKLLVTMLRDPRTNPTAYRRAATRLTFILIEKVIASFDPKSDVVAGNKAVEVTTFCAITLGQQSASFLTAFSYIEPEAPTGQIHVKAALGDGYASWKLEYLDVPDNIAGFEVLLFSISGNGGAECKAIEALRRIGVLERRISIVMVACSRLGYEEISNRYPKASIIAATVDEWASEGWLSPQRIEPVSFAQITNEISRR